MAEDPLITAGQAARLLGVHRSRSHRLIEAGDLRPAASTCAANAGSCCPEVVATGAADWLALAEAARILGVDPQVVQRLMAAGLLTANGRLLPVTRDEVLALTDLRRG